MMAKYSVNLTLYSNFLFDCILDRENKNYTEIAKKMVTDKLMGLVIKDKNVEVKTKSIESFKGEVK